MKLLKFPKSLIKGKNNFIASSVKIAENVVIGNNNKIYDGTVIYPNTVIGDNNVILNNNILGEHPVHSKDNFQEKIHNGLTIGDHNFLHVNNLIFSGYEKKTIIGNKNKFLSNIIVHHDTIIKNYIILYPNSKIAGFCKLLDYSTMGMNSCIQQNSVLGHYSMIGMGNIASHNVFPFFIYFNQKYLRPNKIKIPEELQINLYNNELINMIEDLKKNNCNKEIVKKYKLPKNINDYIYNFLDELKINKI